MKSHATATTTAQAGFAAAVLLLAAAFPATQATPLWEKLQATEEDVSFNVGFRDGGYTKPYRMKFIEDGVRSVYKFTADGCVSNIKVGSERYEPIFDNSNGDVTGVVQTSTSGRRNLFEVAEDGEEDAEEEEVVSVLGRRRLYECDDCVDTWDAVCYEGVPCVCELLNFASELSDAAEKSMTTVCETFGSACSGSSGSEACDGQCEGGEEESTDLNSCLDSASADYRCSLVGSFVDTISFDDCDLVDGDLAYLPACFESMGKENVNQVYLENNLLTTLPEDLFSGLVNLDVLLVRGNQLISLPAGMFSTQTSQLDQLWLSDNNLTTLPDGLFSSLTGIFSLGLVGNPDLQCVPTTSAYETYVDSEEMNVGTCECEPAEAVLCDEDSTCRAGMTGYTCE